MEIDTNINSRSQDPLYNSNDATNPQQNETLFEEGINNKIIANSMDKAQENNQELNSSKSKIRAYNIILRTSFDKTKGLKDKELSQSNNLNNDSANTNTTEACSKNTTKLNLKLPNKFNDNIHQSKEEVENNSKYKMLVDDDDTNIKLNESNNKKANNYQDAYKNEKENNKERKYYNPFNDKNHIDINAQNHGNCDIKCNDEKYDSKKFKMPNIILTTFQPIVKDNKENGGKLSRLWNLFSSRKKEKQIEKKDEIKDEEEPTDKLRTLEERLNEENIKENIIVNDKDICDEKEKPKENNENKDNNKYNFVLGLINSQKEELKENKEVKENPEEINIEGKGKNDSAQNNSNSFIIKAEPILSNNNQENININKYESSQMIDDDKSSQYTTLSASSFINLIKDKSKCSPLLMAILLGSCGLFYLIYKKINLKEIISKCSELFKHRPRFLEYICSFIGACVEDFMERYNDLYRLLVGIICLICFWFIFKLLMKKFMKKGKK